MTKFLKYTSYFTLAIITAAVLIISSAFLYISPKLPAIDSLTEIQLQIPLRIYSKDGQLIGEFGNKRRTPIAHSDVPDLMVKAFLAAEDDGFYRHKGISIRGLSRAI